MKLFYKRLLPVWKRNPLSLCDFSIEVEVAEAEEDVDEALIRIIRGWAIRLARLLFWFLIWLTVEDSSSVASNFI